ncbi:GPO family capsid scaffolding protein, partial [Klebsiella pneumoniae]
ALYGVINPTPDLIELNKKRQKVYTSVEIDPSFSDTGEAYLVGLAVTDNPASLGTEMLQFSANAQSSPLSERKQ